MVARSFRGLGEGCYERRGLGGWVERATGGGWGIVGLLFCAGLTSPMAMGRGEMAAREEYEGTVEVIAAAS